MPVILSFQTTKKICFQKALKCKTQLLSFKMSLSVRSQLWKSKSGYDQEQRPILSMSSRAIIAKQEWQPKYLLKVVACKPSLTASAS